jgi:hypothetical protein
VIDESDFKDSQIWFLNSNCGLDSWLELPKIRPVFTNPTNPHESWRILSTIAQNESLQIQAGGLANPNLTDSYCGFVSQTFFQKIRIMDLIRRTFFQRFVSWIQFVRPKISNYSIHFGRIRVRFSHPYIFVKRAFYLSLGHSVVEKVVDSQYRYDNDSSQCWPWHR